MRGTSNVAWQHAPMPDFAALLELGMAAKNVRSTSRAPLGLPNLRLRSACLFLRGENWGEHDPEPKIVVPVTGIGADPVRRAAVEGGVAPATTPEDPV